MEFYECSSKCFGIEQKSLFICLFEKIFYEKEKIQNLGKKHKV